MIGRTALLLLGVAAACCSKSEVKGGGSASDQEPAQASFTVFALAEVRGQIGPCGCTSDPLGDISRTAKLIADARAAGPVLVVDAGSLLFSQNPIPPQLAAQENLKADLLAQLYQGELHVAAVGLGPADLAQGDKGVRFPREAVDVTDPAMPIAPPRIERVGDAKVGVFGVIATDTMKVALGDPVAAGKQAVAQLRAQGAQLIVGLVQASTKKDAVELMRGIGGIDLAIAGLGQNAPEPERVAIAPDKVGDGWLIVPANRGQVLARIDVTLRGAGPLADAIGKGAATARIAAIDAQLEALDADLARYAGDKDADPAFVAQKKAERSALAAERDRLAAHPLVVPAHGSFFTLDQIRINKTLACSAPVVDAIKHYDAAAGAANVKAAEGTPVPPAPPGKASYVGSASCSDCHGDEAKFWDHTVHAQAWKTLVDRGQQFDLECIGCHVTGWDKPGGSNLAHNDQLRDVQCETCHGPGSIHVAKGGEEKPPAVHKDPPEDLCATQCHTHEHSDTFQREAYLRDIVGKGHGEALRKKLGDGPTGHDLRTAALDKAGRTLGAGCVK
ncbi:MAG TPA: multiheme c-type cytochrome [Kofleriaceae bacterium]|nr:multiheme c-type cytochrome [Kofleriaceae bacterium]